MKKRMKGEIVFNMILVSKLYCVILSSYSREQNSPMGLDVALEEINHLLEADMSDASRNIFKGGQIDFLRRSRSFQYITNLSESLGG